MTPVFAKLNLKHQAEILVLDAPASFEPELQALAGVTVRRDPGAVATVDFALAFVTTRARLDAISALRFRRTRHIGRATPKRTPAR